MHGWYEINWSFYTTLFPLKSQVQNAQDGKGTS